MLVCVQEAILMSLSFRTDCQLALNEALYNLDVVDFLDFVYILCFTIY